ncbi:MAG: class I SAM-dependent methyltransferase [Candidatus Heimdallarchaeota archaeon]|nr:class I SAM-dependent methyltransferase [Candidatus Heimdallarchaeota archaeon]
MKGQVTTNHNQSFFWNLYGRCYDGINHSIPYRGLLYDLYINLDLKPGLKILDAGCGTGNFEKFLSTRSIPSIEIEAVDFSQVMLARAIKKCVDLDFVKFAVADLNQELSYPDGMFDRIVCSNVLYALKNPYSALEEMLRVLRPGGILVIANPKPNSKVARIVIDHFRRIGNIWDIRSKAMTILKTLVLLPTLGLVPILFNVLIIQRKARIREYQFLPREEFAGLFEENDSQHVNIISTYAEQNWLAVATKQFQSRAA